MPPAISVDQELLLKKRARRRLVGAVALVILLMIILPLVLKDRVKTTSNEHAKIVMNEEIDVNALPPAFESMTETSQLATTDEVPSVNNDKEPLGLKEDNNQGNTADNPKQALLPKPVTEDLIANKVAELEGKQSANNATTSSNKESVSIKSTPQTDAVQTQAGFTIQVGAFSDLNNMRQTQANLAKAGFATTTEKVTTPKGDSIRLMAGNYATRESANEALLKLKSIGIDGIIKPKNTYDKSILRN